MAIHLRSSIILLTATGWLWCVAADGVFAEPLLKSTYLTSGFDSPLFATSPPGDDSRLFVVERSGDVKVLDLETNKVLPTPFLEMSGLRTEGEGGLLGMAFHPNYAQNGLVYTFASEANGDILIEGRQVSTDPNVVDESSAFPILRIPHENPYHYSGWLGFGPQDGNLYIGMGDGNTGLSQDPTAPYGKILRIDVNKDGFPADGEKNYGIPADNPYAAGGGAPEVWALGLRNPWRNSFDRATGDFYIGDVGENLREEIDLIPAGSGGGQNFGWNILEGSVPNIGTGSTDGLTPPIYEYEHSEQFGFGIAGGYVFRGDNIGGLAGTYFFSDFVIGRTVSGHLQNGSLTNIVERTTELEPTTGAPIISPVSFGEDGRGRLYIVDLGGHVFRIEAVPAAADPDRNGVVDLSDFGILKVNFGSGTTWDQGDFNADGKVDLSDFGILKANFGKDSSTAPGPSSLAVPEPSSALLGAIALAGLFVGYWRRSR